MFEMNNVKSEVNHDAQKIGIKSYNFDVCGKSFSNNGQFSKTRI